MFFKIISILFGIILGAVILSCLVATLVMVIRVVRHNIRYTAFYKWLVEHEAFNFSKWEQERWEGIKKERWSKEVIDNHDYIRIGNGLYFFTPDYFDSCDGYLINRYEWEKKGRITTYKLIKEVANGDLVNCDISISTY